MDLNPSIARVLRKRNVIRFTTQDGGSATGLETDSSDQHSAHSRVKSAGDYEVYSSKARMRGLYFVKDQDVSFMI